MQFLRASTSIQQSISNSINSAAELGNIWITTAVLAICIKQAEFDVCIELGKLSLTEMLQLHHKRHCLFKGSTQALASRKGVQVRQKGRSKAHDSIRGRRCHACQHSGPHESQTFVTYTHRHCSEHFKLQAHFKLVLTAAAAKVPCLTECQVGCNEACLYLLPVLMISNSLASDQQQRACSREALLRCRCIN